MKKSMLYAGLMTIFSITVFAEESTDPINVKASIPQLKESSASRVQTLASNGVQTPPTQGLQLPTPSDQGVVTPSPTHSKPATVEPTPAASPGASTTTGSATPASSTTTTTTTTSPTTGTTAPASSTTTTTTTPLSTPPASQQLNCNYRIPANITHVEPTVVMKWAEKAAAQSFDFDHDNMDNQLAALKPCYTEQGWQGFNDALQKSGNLSAIKSQQLTVSSMVDGGSTITELKENQWRVIIPLQVVYQNDKQKLTQPLTVNLVVGRKISGDLGIMQMIAMPRQTKAPQATTPPAQ